MICVHTPFLFFFFFSCLGVFLCGKVYNLAANCAWSGTNSSFDLQVLRVDGCSVQPVDHIVVSYDVWRCGVLLFCVQRGWHTCLTQAVTWSAPWNIY